LNASVATPATVLSEAAPALKQSKKHLLTSIVCEEKYKEFKFQKMEKVNLTKVLPI
jgi:hypothetical protein